MHSAVRVSTCSFCSRSGELRSLRSWTDRSRVSFCASPASPIETGNPGRRSGCTLRPRGVTDTGGPGQGEREIQTVYLYRPAVRLLGRHQVKAPLRAQQGERITGAAR
ncbi:Uncharacterised protein [Citrobacter koseri]|nr:Uncharacterised protein [Citrobacter koseri]STT23469.1 Uncharacterised protein [Citrobacter koseri]